MAFIDFQTSLDRQSARTREILERLAAENRARRDLADMGATAGGIARSIHYVGIVLGEAHIEGDPMPADVLPDLRQAQADLAALIDEIEGAA